MPESNTQSRPFSKSLDCFVDDSTREGHNARNDKMMHTSLRVTARNAAIQSNHIDTMKQKTIGSESFYSLYLVTDRGLALGRSTVDIVRAALDGGITCVQLREKNCTTREFLAEAKAVRDLLHGSGVPLIINDRIDVAMIVHADGVHLGQTDMPIAEARRLVGTQMLIGISAECLEDAIRAEAEGADYIGISPVFATPTKTDTAPPLGLEGIRTIRERVSIPLVGIGGIGPGNADQIIRAGCDGIAVVSAIVSAPDPGRAASELSRIIAAAKEKS